MYAIVTTGGKQYRVEQGQSLLVERLPVEDGAKASLRPLLYVDGENVVDGEGLAKVSVEARVVGHERGPKLRVVKFKPKRGYKRRTGHRQELTRIKVTEIKLAERRSARRAPKPVGADEAAAATAAADAATPATAGADATGPPEAAPKPKAPRAKAAPESAGGAPTRKPKGETPDPPAKPARPRRKPKATDPEPEEGSGA